MEPQVSTFGGRHWQWPAKECAKAVKKEKLFERREVELWLRALVIDRLRCIVPGPTQVFFF
jgi:hypothetical protein